MDRTWRVPGKSLDEARLREVGTAVAQGYAGVTVEVEREDPEFITFFFGVPTAQGEDAALRARFASVAQALSENESGIVAELNGAQGPAMAIGGYYPPDETRAAAAMRPSETLNRSIESR